MAKKNMKRKRKLWQSYVIIEHTLVRFWKLVNIKVLVKLNLNESDKESGSYLGRQNPAGV